MIEIINSFEVTVKFLGEFPFHTLLVIEQSGYEKLSKKDIVMMVEDTGDSVSVYNFTRSWLVRIDIDELSECMAREYKGEITIRNV